LKISFVTSHSQPDHFDRREPLGTQLNNLIRSDWHLTWLHLAFLFPATILPFTTRLLTELLTYRTALLAY
jgi:hypothetical protein